MYLFTKHARDGKKSILIVCVDDMIITEVEPQKMEDLKKHLRAEFEVKDLVTLRYFLDMEVARTKQGLFISQRKYTLDLLNETRKLGCKPGRAPEFEAERC